MPRKRFEWKLNKRTIRLGERALLVGVLNVTPDSFSDGGKYEDPDRAFARAMEMEEQGADIIDIGAESTKPGSARVSEAEELRRLVPVLKRLHNKLGIPISVDTYKAAVAEKALDLGAEIINDPSGLTFDPELAKTVLHHGAGLILNHMRGTPETWAKLPPLQNLVATVTQELEAAAHRAIRAGVERKAIVIDPGLGFGKRREQNAEILSQLGAFARLEFPLMVGPSRKHFLAKDTTEGTEFATAAAVTACVLGGAYLVRVHDVKAMKAVMDVTEEILRAGEVHSVQAEVVHPGRPNVPPKTTSFSRPPSGPGGPRRAPLARPERPNVLPTVTPFSGPPSSDADAPASVPVAQPEQPDAPPKLAPISRPASGPEESKRTSFVRPERRDGPPKFKRPSGPNSGPDGPKRPSYARPERSDGPPKFKRPSGPNSGPDGPKRSSYGRPERSDGPPKFKRPSGPNSGPDGPKRPSYGRPERPNGPPKFKRPSGPNSGSDGPKRPPKPSGTRDKSGFRAGPRRSS